MIKKPKTLLLSSLSKILLLFFFFYLLLSSISLHLILSLNVGDGFNYYAPGFDTLRESKRFSEVYLSGNEEEIATTSSSS
jgi:hypothetical protein